MRLAVFFISIGLWLLSAPAVLAVVVLDAGEHLEFQGIDLIEVRSAQGRSDSPLDTFSLAGLAVDRGQVVLDHHRPLILEFRDPVNGIAFRLSDPRNQAMLALTLFRGEHAVGAQVFAHRKISGSRVALIQDGRIAIASEQDFDRIELRRIDFAQDALPLTIESLSLPSSTDALNESLASRGTVESLACMLPLTAVYVPAYFASLSTLFGPAAGRVAFVSNLALKFCKPSLTAPADIMLAPPPGECEVEFQQPRMAATFQTALAFTFNSGGGWGELGSPTKFHFNTDVDVMLLAGNPGPPTAKFTDFEFFLSSASFDASDKIWESCRDDGSVRYSQFEGSGPQYECPYVEDRTLAFPVGRTTVAWRANPRVSPVDLLDVFIPGIPPGAKNQPLRSMIYNLWIQLWLDVLDGSVDGWRLPHAQFDYQTITIIDEVPPTITPLPGSEGFATAELVGDILHVTIQADEIGGVSRRRYESILRSFLQVSDACDRPTTLQVSFETEGLSSFWPITTATQDNSHIATWTARDPGPNADGVPNETITTMRIEVVDLQPPTIIPPPDIVEIDSAQVTDLGQPAVFDLVDINPQVSHDANLPLGLGLHEVTWTATDAAGNSASGIQIVNVKASNIPPVALAQTGPDRQQAVSFEPTPIRLHGNDPDGDPLRFKIEDRPDNGFFVAPLYPYFIEDFRIEQSITNAELLDICANEYWPSGSFNLDFPSEPSFLTVTDDGRTYVVDRGRIRCQSNPAQVFRDDRLAVFDNQGSLLNSLTIGQNQLRDVVLDLDRDRLVLTSHNSAGDSSVRVLDLELQQIVNYRLQDMRNRTDGLCSNLGGLGGGCTFQYAHSAVVDDNDLIYVMNNHGSILVVDGTLPPDFDCGSQCTYRPKFVSALVQSTNFSGTELMLDKQGRLYAARINRIYRYTASYVADDGLAYPGTLDGWLGRCDIDLAPGDQAVCDVTNQRSLGFSCTDEYCQVDSSNNEAACPDAGFTFNARLGCQPGQFMSGPSGLDIAPDGTVYVADGGNERIQRFSTDGFFAGQAKSTGSGTGFVIGDFGRPQNVSVNSSHFYILDPDTNLLHISLLTPFVEIGHDYADLVYQSNNQFACEDSADCIDRFSFRVSDGVRDPVTGQPEVSAPAEVEVEVSRNFRPPFATPGISVVVMEDTPTPVPLDGSDPDPLDTLSFEIVDPPSKGSVQIVGQNATFFPDANAWGPDSFSFRVSDGVFTSAPETVDVYIIEINDPPIISVPEEAILGGTGFRTKLRLAFRDPDPDESHTVAIDWGDGTVEPEGTFDADGNPTGPILSHGGTDSGRITADHVFLTPGNKSVEVCVTDRMQPGPGGTKIPTPGLSLTACEFIPVTIVDGIDLALSAEASTDVALPGQFIIYDFQVENRLPEAGAGVTATGIELAIRLASGFDPSNITTPLGCSRNGFWLACSVSNLSPGQSETFSMALQVATNTPSGRLLVSEARAELDQPTIHSQLSMVLHTPVSRPADFQVGAVGDALKDKPAANPGDGICASVDGVCTLRAAVEEAAASGTPKVIALANGLYLLDEHLDLSGDIMLIGNGPQQTRIHGSLRYVGGSGLRLENLTISGGGLVAWSMESLTTRRVRFTGNSAEGSFGGAISAGSTVLDIRDTTFDNNRTDIDGGSLACGSCSGVMENVTVTGGSGGGLLFLGSGHVDLKHVTIVNNNGGAWYSLPAGGSLHVYDDMTVTLANSVLADNHRLLDPYDREAVNCAVGADASLISLGNNALGDLAGCNLTLLASDILIDNARLLQLAAGLDGLPVRKPRANSPLVDAFNDASCLDTDARGLPRPMDGNHDGIAWCDIGAVERRTDRVFRDRFRLNSN
jgi:predicted outer membrane repeat protein